MALRVVIDPGHGGTDGGASGNGIVEKNMTLDISKAMYDEFKRLGIPVYMTRTTDETLSPSERTKRILNAFGKDSDVIVISNHINAGGGSGAEVIYALRNNEKLSSNILSELAKEGQTIRKYYQKRGTSNPNKDYYFIHRETPNTEAVIVEYGFLDTKADADRLKKNYKNYALAVVEAVLDYKGIVPEQTDYYTVKAGDTLYAIARKFGMTVDKLKSLNNLSSNNLSIGQKLLVTDELQEEGVYTVQKGDTLYSIAKKYYTTVDKIMSMNNLSTNMLSVGQKLVIPESVGLNTYIVKRGDTLYSIARLNNTTVSAIKIANNLTSDILSIGQELIIPS